MCNVCDSHIHWTENGSYHLLGSYGPRQSKNALYSENGRLNVEVKFAPFSCRRRRAPLRVSLIRWTPSRDAQNLVSPRTRRTEQLLWQFIKPLSLLWDLNFCQKQWSTSTLQLLKLMALKESFHQRRLLWALHWLMRELKFLALSYHVPR